MTDPNPESNLPKVSVNPVPDEFFMQYFEKSKKAIAQDLEAVKSRGYLPRIFIVATPRNDPKNLEKLEVFAEILPHQKTAQGRRLMFRELGEAFVGTGYVPLMIFHGNEAWASVVRGLKKEDMPQDYAPSKDPNRREVIILSGSTWDGKQVSTLADIHRHPLLHYIQITGWDTHIVDGESVKPEKLENYLTESFFRGFTSANKEFNEFLTLVELAKENPEVANRIADLVFAMDKARSEWEKKRRASFGN